MYRLMSIKLLMKRDCGAGTVCQLQVHTCAHVIRKPLDATCSGRSTETGFCFVVDGVTDVRCWS